MSDPIFTTHHDHDKTRYTVSHFPQSFLMSPELLGSLDSEIAEACVHLNVANGYAEYHVVGWDPERRGLVLSAVTRSPEHLQRNEPEPITPEVPAPSA